MCGMRISMIKVWSFEDERLWVDEVKQLVLPFKVIGFGHQSRPLSKVKQLVLL